ncbi:transmembrane 4 L6 family member 5-like [Pelobates fuscus]|uniref:transmembrane 4 L6 family member 5-like n=1 Tax=Pelobates fuscus TaxID=191477 RepID=UPI002FE4DB16
MCTGKCSKFIGVSLYPLILICITANLMMFFPDWSTEYIVNAGEQITQEVRSVGGIVGGGLLVLISAVHIQATGRKGCCNNRCGMFLSIAFSIIGLGGAVFGFLMSLIGLLRGPVCQFNPTFSNDDNVIKPTNGSLVWGRPFDGELEELSDDNYLFHPETWNTCVAPPNVVMFNVILFSTTLVATGIEIILCAVQVLNGLFGCICGTCRKEKNEKGDKGELIE